MAKLKIRSQGLRAWYQKLLELASYHDIPQPVKDHINKVSTDLPHVNPSEMSVDDTSRAFGLKRSTSRPWQFPKVQIKLPESFLGTFEVFETLTKRAKPTETRVRYKLDVLISTVYQALSTQNMLDDGLCVTLAHKTTVRWGPIIYKDEPHICSGRADYSLFFGEKDHLTCHVVMIEAKQFGGEGHGQLLAYMAMVQENRKKRGQSDWTVYGVLSDGEVFTFYRLEMDGQFTFVILQALYEGWQAIANMLAFFILEGVETCASHVRSSLASNPSARNSHPQSSPQLLPPLDTLPSIEDMMDTEMKV